MTTTDPNDLDLQEMVQMMDVASTLRREHELVERQFDLDRTKKALRERLLAASEAAGESLTAEEIDAAINRYFEHLHAFRPPPLSLSLALAHLYVRRATVGIAAAVLVVVGGLAWWIAT